MGRSPSRLAGAALLTGLSLLLAPSVRADPSCGAVEFRFQPGQLNLQIAIWVEDSAGKVVDTPYITRATGQFGLANRPGAALLKTDCGWPYGRRDMVLPIWAHRRNHHYPKVVMGGACGNSPDSECPGLGYACGGDCEDATIAYHSKVSSAESYYCAPQGCTANTQPDVITCASLVRTLSKGAYDDPAMIKSFSLYPPRADLTEFHAADSPDTRDFAVQNDVAAVSHATPRPGSPISPALYWNPANLPDGDYVAWIELSQEADFNAANNHPQQDDKQREWNGQGHAFLGQPSVTYKVPFHYSMNGYSAFTGTWAGYSTWDGSDGVLHPPDGTIADSPGSGAGRLIDIAEGSDLFRFKVLVGACSGDGGIPRCVSPAPVGGVTVVPGSTGLKVSFAAPASMPLASQYVVRYLPGGAPVDAKSFNSMLVGPALMAHAPGEVVSASIDSLNPDTAYTVAVEAMADCGATSAPTTTQTRTTQLAYTVLHGCFIATAAFGTPLDAHLAPLRSFRDRVLLPSVLGRLAVASYYAFSPAIAGVIAPEPALRALVRRGLAPIVSVVEQLAL